MTRAIVQIGGPFIALLMLIGAFFAYEPLRRPFGGTPPPVEELTVERTVLDERGIALKVRVGGTEPLSIAQVQVDGAYWSFAQDPPGALPRLSGAWISIPYPWVEGETHKIVFVTRTGLTFEHTIDVAWPTPKVDADALGRLTLAGLFLGVLPIALGMLFYPALKSGGAVVFQFAMALTLGLLAFLLVDTFSEAFEIAGRAAPGLKSTLLVWIIATLACMLLWGVAHWRGQELTSLGLAASIAFAIGVHNLGEGLAVGSAFATGAAALGGFLLLGFTVSQCDGRRRHRCTSA
jgi:ZIP family zinc transporter